MNYRKEFFPFYFEQQIKRELQGIHICRCRCNENLKTKTVQGNHVSNIHWVVWGTRTPMDRDEINR